VLTAGVALVVLRATAAHAADKEALLPAARVTVDSTFRGYRIDVLTDGAWIELGKEITHQHSHRDRLGNCGNSWVSNDTPAEHWVRLAWPEPVRLNSVSVWWTQPDWYPRAFRVEVLRDQSWVPAMGPGTWFKPTAQYSEPIFAPTMTTAVRVIQHARGGVERSFLAVQEVTPRLKDHAASGCRGARALNPREARRLESYALERDLTQLYLSQPGAVEALTWAADGTIKPLPALIDESAPIRLPKGAVAFGVRWPIQHVVDEAELLVDGSRAATAELQIHDGAGWRPVRGEVTGTPGGNGARYRFAPGATTAVRFQTSHAQPLVRRIGVLRYMPSGPHEWPDRLIKDNRFERELLQRGKEPSFEGLATAALSMRPAHALLGLKDSTQTAGATWDGSIKTRRGELSFHFGPEALMLADRPDTVTRELVDGWRPGVVVRGRIDELLVRETAFVSFAGPGRSAPALFVEMRVTNLGAKGAEVIVGARLRRSGVAFTARDGCLWHGSQPALVGAKTRTAGRTSRGLSTTLSIPPGESASATLRLPLAPDGKTVSVAQYRQTSGERALAVFRAYWDEVLAPATVISVPEPRVSRMAKAVVAQIFVNGEGDVMYYGAYPSAYARKLYGVEESYCMRALAMLGFPADAQRYLNGTYLTPEFMRKVNGYKAYAHRHQQYRNGLVPSYAIATFRITRDLGWVRKHEALFRTCAEWTLAARRKTMAEGEPRPLHWGLLPKWSYGGDIAGLQCHAFYANFACLRGLYETAWLLAELGHRGDAQRYRKEADRYRDLLMAAVDRSYLRNAQPPFLPLRLYADKPVGNDYYQLFANLLLELGAFAGDEPRTRYITDFLEQGNLTFCLLPRFRRDVGPGGLDGIYSLGHVLTKLHQDRIDEFLLGFYGYLAFNLERDTFAARETNLIFASDLHRRSSYRVPDMSDPVPCASAVAVLFLRHLLLTESPPGVGRTPDELLLLYGAPRAWFQQGKQIQVERAPCHFGKVTVTVTSDVDAGRITARVVPPTRNVWRRIRLRLRHPGKKKPRDVIVNGQRWTDVDREREIIDFRPGPATFTIAAFYDD